VKHVSPGVTAKPLAVLASTVLSMAVCLASGAGAARSQDSPPALTLQEPLADTVARPDIRLRARCTDDAGSCSITVTLLRANNTSQTLATGTWQIDQTVSLASEYVNGLSNPRLRFTATDSAGQTTTRTIQVWVENNSTLVETHRAPGAILDDSSSHVLFIDDTWRIVLMNKSPLSQATVFQAVKGSDSLYERPYGYLKPNGGAIIVSGPYDSPPFRVYDWNGTTLTAIGTANPTTNYLTTPARSREYNLKVVGDRAIWTDDNVPPSTQLMVRNLTAGTQSAAGASLHLELSNSLAPNGAYVWTDPNGIDFHGFRSGTGTVPVEPRTDGQNVAYWSSPDVHLVDATDIATDFRRPYHVAGGWLAGTRTNGSNAEMDVWVRSPAGVLTKVTNFNSTFSTPPQAWGLRSDGTPLTRYRGLVYLGAGTQITVSTPFDRLSFRGNDLYLIIGRSVFRNIDCGNPSTTSASFGTAGGTGSVSVSAASACQWTAFSNDSWLTVTSGVNYTGSQTVQYSVASNPATQRTGTMIIAGNTFTVTQAGTPEPPPGPCSYSLSPTSAVVGSAAGSGSVGVVAQEGCGWTASSNASWISITSGNSGSGSGPVSYATQANLSASARTGTLTIAGQTFTLTQSGKPSAEDGFAPGVNNTVYAIAQQADGKLIIGGDFTMLGGGGTGHIGRQHIGRLNVDGSIDLSFDPGANGQVFALAIQPDGKILVGGDFTTMGGGGAGGTTRQHIARLNADGSLDAAFNPGANAFVRTLAVQPNGKILVGGDFATLGGGGTGTTARNFIGRLNPDGTIDATFNPGADGIVSAITLQSDGSMLAGGAFSSIGGGGTGSTMRHRLARLNAAGTVDMSFNPGANAGVRAMSLQPDGRILVGGEFTMLGGGGTGTTSRNRLGRLNADGTLDPGFNPGADDVVFSIVPQLDGKVLVGGAFVTLGGTARSRIGRLAFDGSLDMAFNPGANGAVRSLLVQQDTKIVAAGAFTMLAGGGSGAVTQNYVGRLYLDGVADATLNPNPNGIVRALALQPDGRIVFGGDFTEPRVFIGRLLADGSLDAAFAPASNGTVAALVVQPDGKILVGGNFTTLGGSSRLRLGRLNPDGTLDGGFNPGATHSVRAIALQPDGKILIGGDFNGVGGGTGATARSFIARLLPDGTLDSSFNPGADGIVSTLALQPNGQILVGGLFTRLGGGGTGTTTRQRIGRLNADGSLDGAFNPGANNLVRTVTGQPDDKILVGGEFSTLGQSTVTNSRLRLGRLYADGSLDGFNPGANHTARSFALQSDGKIVVSGAFWLIGGGTGTTSRYYIARLNDDGSIDPSFDPGQDTGHTIVDYAVAIQPDGKILVGGSFTAIGGAARQRLARLSNNSAATQSLTVSGAGSVVRWNRGGAGPEVRRVTFEWSTDGTTFAALGDASRVAGGWELTGQSLPTQQNLFVRARGSYATAEGNGSGSIVELIRNVYPAGPTVFTDDPVTAGSVLIKAVHVIELRTRIDAQRTRYGLLAFDWTDPSLSPSSTVRAVHWAELRTALQQAYTGAGLSAPSFTDPTLTAGSTIVRAAHIQELRNAVVLLEGP
jgi:uncharacterized delta-60 repeat protein